MAEEYNPDIITLEDDDGKEYTFEVLDRIETDEARYIALLPVYDKPEEMLQDSGELVILKVAEENGEEYFVDIEDDAEYDMIADAFTDRLQDIFEIEEADSINSACPVRECFLYNPTSYNFGGCALAVGMQASHNKMRTLEAQSCEDGTHLPYAGYQRQLTAGRVLES